MGLDEPVVNVDDPSFYNGWPMNTPRDIRLGQTHEDRVNHKLRWGILSASAIASDWIKSLQDVPCAEVTAVAARDKVRAEAYAKAQLGAEKRYRRKVVYFLVYGTPTKLL